MLFNNVIGDGTHGKTVRFAIGEKMYKLKMVEREEVLSSGTSGNKEVVEEMT
jgi:hypothetical protein